MRPSSRRGHSGRRRPLLVVLGIAAALGVGTVASPSQAATDYKDTYKLVLGVTNPCNGEDVTLTGTVHEQSHTTRDAKGGYHTTYHVNWSGFSGTGTLGNAYRAADNDLETYNSAGAYEDTYTTSMRVVGQNSAPSFIVRDQFHETYNADGTLTSTHHNYTVDPYCKG